MRILVLNGPNLNLLGQRDPALYGTEPLEGIIDALKKAYPEQGIEHLHSNHEGELIDALHQAEGQKDGIVFNPAGYTHSSIALGDAVEAIRVPVVEVHISNIFAREGFRQHSYIAPHAVVSISGGGSDVYPLAMEHLVNGWIKGS